MTFTEQFAFIRTNHYLEFSSVSETLLLLVPGSALRHPNFPLCRSIHGGTSSETLLPRLSFLGDSPQQPQPPESPQNQYPCELRTTPVGKLRLAMPSSQGQKSQFRFSWYLKHTVYFTGAYNSPLLKMIQSVVQILMKYIASMDLLGGNFVFEVRI